MRGFSKGCAALAVLLLSACQPAEKVTPALWQVDGPGGQRAWLLGTIHALERPVDWRSAKVDTALAGADRVVLEVARIDDTAGMAMAFAALGTAQTSVPLRSRVPAHALANYDRYLKSYGIDEQALAGQETWSAALILAQAAQQAQGSEAENGVDRAVAQAAGRRPVEEFEGADTQLKIFDALPEAEQRDLLAAVVSASREQNARETRALRQAWAKGDVQALTRETQSGLLADPELRAALLVGRNKAWTGQVLAMLRRGQRPFVAVGTAHLAGPDGLPAMLAAGGYRVTRLQ
ncbi:TraB/GumN family protein [Novosphingobium sp. B 225]|uniref:TraB/GumN family protein n=1 Tax=Novosphingobium sp. B 225 TaxID=1961849 RepID=UPI0020CF5768|nr:TraB/GumN family protein [Novosphingobium sp. B 225]